MSNTIVGQAAVNTAKSMATTNANNASKVNSHANGNASEAKPAVATTDTVTLSEEALALSRADAELNARNGDGVEPPMHQDRMRNGDGVEPPKAQAYNGDGVEPPKNPV